MDNVEAKSILSQQLRRFIHHSHDELRPLVEAGHVEVVEVPGPSGAVYQIEIQFFWDDKAGETIRVVGSVDDGGLRAFFPLTDSFLVEAVR